MSAGGDSVLSWIRSGYSRGSPVAGQADPGASLPAGDLRSVAAESHQSRPDRKSGVVSACRTGGSRRLRRSGVHRRARANRASFALRRTAGQRPAVSVNGMIGAWTRIDRHGGGLSDLKGRRRRPPPGRTLADDGAQHLRARLRRARRNDTGLRGTADPRDACGPGATRKPGRWLPSKRKLRLSGAFEEPTRGFEPRTPSLRVKCSTS